MNPSLKKVRSLMERKIHDYSPAPVMDSQDFIWGKKVESSYPHIRLEAEAVLRRVDEVINFNSVLPNQRALTQGDNWKSFFIIAGGKDLPHHQELCPQTTNAVKQIPGLINAFFSILRPGVHIPPHRGPYAGLLRYHLGLIIPEGDTAIRIDRRICHWKEGESLFFDDSFEHEAWNRTDSDRVILFVDAIRPLPVMLSVLNRMMIQGFMMSREAKAAHKTLASEQIKK